MSSSDSENESKVSKANKKDPRIKQNIAPEKWQKILHNPDLKDFWQTC